MVEKLLKKIKELENEIEEIKKKNEIVSNNIKELFNECKIEKSKKEKFKTKLFKNLNALKIDYEKTFKGGILSFEKFLDFIQNESNVYILVVKLPLETEKTKYLYGYFVKKFNPIFTVKDNMLIGIIEKQDLSKIKKLKVLPFYNTQTEEFDEIELFKVIFEADEINTSTFNKIFSIFKELTNRPSFKNKHFIEYSLPKNRIVDFEMEEIKKEKEKYSFIYEETYPSLEIKLKSNINNAPFILALLERIDKEIGEIKKSRGIINVVNRILNYIELRTREEELKRMVKTLKNALKN